MRSLLVPLSLALALAPSVRASDPEPIGPGLHLKLIAPKETVTWDGGGKTPKELQKMLEEIEKAAKKNPFDGPMLPPAPKVDLVLRIVNGTRKPMDVWLGGDMNVVTLELKGPGVKALNFMGAFTTELRLARKFTLEAGKHHDIPLERLSDGLRGMARSVYWTEPGEYTLSATYQLSSGPEEKGKLLKSNTIKLKVQEKK
jgi:hypothetical protein